MLPLYAIGATLIPVILMNSSAARWDEDAREPIAQLSCPGLALASAINSLMELTPKDYAHAIPLAHPVGRVFAHRQRACVGAGFFVR